MASPTVSVTQRVPHCDWTMLPLALMQLVFERLGFLDFERAKLVCSSWHSVSRQSRRPKIPWMILFPVEENYCLLFNPEDKEKLYKTQLFGNDFYDSFCLTTYRSWLLMQTYYFRDYFSLTSHTSYDMYILDILTGERINLPAVDEYNRFQFATLWIEEKIKDYLVIGMVISSRGSGNSGTLVSLKKGDNSWKQITELHLSKIDRNFNMVYKDHKLYCLDYSDLRIFDVSGESPLQVFRISVDGYVCRLPGAFCRMRLPDIPDEFQRDRWKNNVVVTVRGDVLIVGSGRKCLHYAWNFKIYKMMDSSTWEELVSLGDESILLDLGVTVLAKDIEGISNNSIYFTASGFWDEYEENKVFIFNLDTKKGFFMQDIKKPVDKEEEDRENEKLEKKLRELGLTIIEIKPDGHCLYRAVENQLALLSGGGTSPPLTFQNLREMAASYMRQHMSPFVGWVSSYRGEKYPREVERREVEGLVIGSMNLSVEVQFEKYCQEVEQTAERGGELELKALAWCLKKHIIVYSGSFPAVEMGKEYKSGHDSSIILSCHRHAYGLDDHYNSVVHNITG